MRSIVSQLLRHLRGHSANLEDVLGDLIKAKEWGGGTLRSAKELAGFASRAASLLSQKPLVVVDALDECKDVQIIVDLLSDLPFVSMEDMADKLSADIELHVTRELDARRRLRDLDSGFKMEIRSVLCDKADGMFRWAQCSIDTLDRSYTRKDVRIALGTLPRGLDETHERILLAIDAETLAGQLVSYKLVLIQVFSYTYGFSLTVNSFSAELRRKPPLVGYHPCGHVVKSNHIHCTPHFVQREIGHCIPFSMSNANHLDATIFYAQPREYVDCIRFNSFSHQSQILLREADGSLDYIQSA
ncbi:hypothetical protein L210DRAFT_2969499 [Boletus edulis BED1]|uniref:Uncharacterized protein n=1 Tax=Boletus edulis BED1 TaxID=1328754 RepID=A0AAD4GIW3_BOLED|nr:hypothetical protein L210DRAFT_2969499 [Boletus edulis BED1]